MERWDALRGADPTTDFRPGLLFLMVFGEVWQIFVGRLQFFCWLVSHFFSWQGWPHHVPHLITTQISPQSAQDISNNLYLYTAAQ